MQVSVEAADVEYFLNLSSSIKPLHWWPLQLLRSLEHTLYINRLVQRTQSFR